MKKNNRTFVSNLKAIAAFCIVVGCSWNNSLRAQTPHSKTSFVVSMPEPANHLFHVRLLYNPQKEREIDFKMSAWTPGFYEIIDFSSAVLNFTAKDIRGSQLPWKKTDTNTWHVSNVNKNLLVIDYDVNAVVPFVGNNYLDKNYGYFVPGGLLMYTNAALRHPVSLKVEPYRRWPEIVATGLNTMKGQKNNFYAADYDELYDSPVLVGDLETLPSFKVYNTPHYFFSYNLGTFDRGKFIQDLKKITKSTIDIFGDIPFKHYTFLATGMNNGGFGGIEHMTSASLMMGNKGLFAADRKETFYEFLAHEYFHLYNVKRIRPIELGPFDYSKENRTDLLWVAEGVTDYYEYLIVRSAGLINDQQVLKGYQEHISNYENTPGHLYQSLATSSRNIWAVRGAPTTRNNEELEKTISLYDKGCALALMLDLKIRHETHNKYSLDDVMRALYRNFYLGKKRGFTDRELWRTCEQVSGVTLNELHSYSTTVKAVDYPKYFAYAGLEIDTSAHHLTGNNLGITPAVRDSSLLVKAVSWNSPAFKAGLRQNDRLLWVGDKKASMELFQAPIPGYKDNDTLHIGIIRSNKQLILPLNLTPWSVKLFTMKPYTNRNALQKKIYNSWLRNRK